MNLVTPKAAAKHERLFNKHSSDVYAKTENSYQRGKDQYSPCTNRFRSALFKIENIFLPSTKTSYLNLEVNCAEPSPSIRVPWTKTSFYLETLATQPFNQ